MVVSTHFEPFSPPRVRAISVRERSSFGVASASKHCVVRNHSKMVQLNGLIKGVVFAMG